MDEKQVRTITGAETGADEMKTGADIMKTGTGSGAETGAGVKSGAEPGTSTETGTERKLKTRCYYTDYVNHAIRFYLSTPETLNLDGKRRADMDNWISVQAVFHCLSSREREIITDVYKTHHCLPVAVEIYCKEHNASQVGIWTLITRTCAAIAKRRGLV